MEFILRQQNKYILWIFISILLLLIITPILSNASIYDYNPDIDISLGGYYLIFHDNNNFTISGAYIGILYLMQSPLLKNLFSTNNFYSIYNLGTVFLGDRGNNRTILLIPLSIDISYKIHIFKNFNLFPFAGWGISIIPINYPEINKNAFLSFNVGLLTRYRLWNSAYLKLQIEFGTIFGRDLGEKGYVNYIRVVCPVPFIP